MDIGSVVSLGLVALAVSLVVFRPLDHRIRWPVAIITLALYVRYLTWRGLFTLELAFPHILISVPLYLAEIYFIGQLLFFFLQVARPKTPTARLSELPYFPSVDVFIITYNEPPEVLRRTVLACLALEYPKKRVYLLDDGRRPEIERLALRLGCLYLTRPDNTDAKAGNINAALQRTSGEFVVMFDSDHAPVRSFLSETIGFFRDQDVAFVQTVQHFYNPDPIQRNLFLREALDNEQDMFFRTIMPGRERFNATFWTGTGAIFRREALQQVGGVQTGTVTEDFHTTLELHARGWRSVHLNRVLSAGLSPEGYEGYLTQRVRWTQGMFQVWRRANPLFRAGLSLSQRLFHFASLYYFFFGLGRLVFLAAPLCFLLFGVKPLHATPLELSLYFLPNYITVFLVFPLFTGWRRLTVSSEIYEVSVCFLQAPAALLSLLMPVKRAFKVTPKGLGYSRAIFNWKLAVPQISVALLYAIGIVMGIWNLTDGLAPGQRDSYIINLGWAGYNILLLTLAVLLARDQPQSTIAHQVQRRIPCELSVNGQVYRGETVHISQAGASIKTPDDIGPTDLATINIYGIGGDILELPVQVLSSKQNGDVRLTELRFFFVSERQESDLSRFLFSPDWAWDDESVPRLKFWETLALILFTPFRVVKLSRKANGYSQTL